MKVKYKGHYLPKGTYIDTGGNLWWYPDIEEEEPMPYIPEKERYELQIGYGDRLRSPETAGELNFNLTFLVQDWLGQEPNYDKFNAAIGVLESAKLELYRRMVAPYEDKKIKENGDVY